MTAYEEAVFGSCAWAGEREKTVDENESALFQDPPAQRRRSCVPARASKKACTR